MKTFCNKLTASVNIKGVCDIDSVKGCAFGTTLNKNGCYGLCYANRIASARGFDFSKSISRQPDDRIEKEIESLLHKINLSWFRIGTMGDPSHDWPLTLYVCERFGKIKTPVVVTKHWMTATEAMLARMIKCGTVFNTSISALDEDVERSHRLEQYHRIAALGGRSFLRIVTADFGDTGLGRYLRNVQGWLLSNKQVIDTPLRIPLNDTRVENGTIRAKRVMDLQSDSSISLWNDNVYIGHCGLCPDQCGAINGGARQ